MPRLKDKIDELLITIHEERNFEGFRFNVVSVSAGWPCENRHLDPDTGREFLNDPARDRCEICSRPRPSDERTS